ncbi:hypothetical protein ABZ319_39810 [Nocardia sp. NPDC005978]|uniref:hypothetical protein n=1 Tax=Nocardia sp. NPDC005978 TaxID=3156725 RepID=UPI0033A290A9
MSGDLVAVPAEIAASGKKAMALQGTHEGYLGALASVKEEFRVAASSAGAGDAAQSTLQNAHMAGVKLGRSLQEVIEVLVETGVRIDTSDMDAAAGIDNASALGSNGKIDNSSWS